MKEVFIVKVIGAAKGLSYLGSTGYIDTDEPYVFDTWIEARNILKESIDSFESKDLIFEIVSAYQKTGE